MDPNKLSLIKVDVSGTTLETKVLDEGDPDYFHNIYMFITLGDKETPSNVNVDGVDITLPAGFRFNDIPIQKLQFNGGGGILVFIRRSKRQLF